MIDTELDGTDRTLAARGWSAGGRANGYYLADVRTAAGARYRDGGPHAAAPAAHGRRPARDRSA